MQNILKKECSNFANFMIKQIPQNENSRVDALATLNSIREVNNTKILIVTILIETSMEEAEKAVENIYEVDTSWFTPILIFPKDQDLHEDKKKIKEIESKVRQYMIHGNKIYIKITLEHGLLCIVKECSTRVMYEAHEWKCGSYSGGIKLSQQIIIQGYY